MYTPDCCSMFMLSRYQVLIHLFQRLRLDDLGIIAGLLYLYAYLNADIFELLSHFFQGLECLTMELISFRMPVHAFCRRVDGLAEAVAELLDFWLMRIVVSRTDPLDADFKGTSRHDAWKVGADGDEAVERGRYKTDQ